MRTLIVDAYNVIHAHEVFLARLSVSLEASRESLIGYCVEYKRRVKDIARIILVFDGAGEMAETTNIVAKGVRIIFSPKGLEADRVILDMIEKIGLPAGQIVVVSNDNYVCNNARARSVNVMSVREFTQNKSISSPEKAPKKEKDLPGAIEKKITREYRRLLGIEENES